MSMSGESAFPPGRVMSCGTSDSVRPVIRRPHTWVEPSAATSPQVATAYPSADTATFGRSRPVPASALMSMSSGWATRVHVVSCRRAATTLPLSSQIAYAAPLTPRSRSSERAFGPPTWTAGANPPGVSPPGDTET